ncbi:MAG: hypothetical protein K2G63_01220 [Oscillospiraceae bacterium]|nr:hypothetical protein [Oscillospiraceae bacterium]
MQKITDTAKIFSQCQEMRELTHQALKLYVPKEMYDYICGMVDMAHTFGMTATQQDNNSDN